MIENITATPPIARPPLPVRAMRWLWRLAVDRVYRNVMWLYFVRPQGAFQPFNDTLHNRYPEIFRFVQAELGAASEIGILSYGCSVGDEVFSLRRYFPRAIIKGIDINPGNIAAAWNNHRMPTSHSRRHIPPQPSLPAAMMRSSAWPCCAMAVSVCPA